MTKKKPKTKTATRKPLEDINQIAYRVMQEIIKRSEGSATKKCYVCKGA